MDTQGIASGRRQPVPAFALAMALVLAVAVSVLALQTMSLRSTKSVPTSGLTTIGSARFATPHSAAGGQRTNRYGYVVGRAGHTSQPTWQEVVAKKAGHRP
jgi:hypothetical protein